MVQYFPVITGSLTVNGDIIVSGTSSMSASNSVSSSYAYTASSAISSSYAYSASSAVNSFSASKAVSSSYADTASFSNDFTVLGNLTVYGTQSVQYITSSQLNVSDNVITVNVASPGVRFGGLSVFDSGSLSSEATASLFWDSQNNHWIYQRESGSSYTGGMLISGPRNAAGLGNELGTTNCMLLVGQGGDHLTSSMIYHDSTATCIPNALISTSSSLFLNGTNKRISTYAPSCWVGISDYICNGVGFQFTRPNDDAFAHAIFSFNGTTTNNLAISSRSDLVIATGGGLGGSDERMRITSEGRVGIGACVMNYAKLNVYNNTNDATYNSKIQAIFGNSDYRASDAIQIFGAGTSETQFLNGSTSRPAMISLGGNLATSEAVGVINFFRSDNAATYRSRAQIWAATNASGCSTTLGGFLTFNTADTGQTNPQERIRITSGGFVGIGTSSPEAYLTVCQQCSSATAATAPYGIYITGREVYNPGSENAGGVTIGMGVNRTSNRQLWIKSTDSAVNGTNALFRIQPNGTQVALGSVSTNGDTGTSLALNASCVLANGVGIGGASDERVKDDIVDLNYGLSSVMCLRPRTFKFKGDCSMTHVGFVAQEVLCVLPNFVVHDKLNDTIVKYGNVELSEIYRLELNGYSWASVLTKAIQEQQCTINTLKTCIGIA
jgi:Chaperone of endosialidase